MAADPGIEPGFPDSESGVLPLDESATAKIYITKAFQIL
jgi:hypothetical protein